VDCFDKSHGISLLNPTARRDVSGNNHDAVENANNPNFFVSVMYKLYMGEQPRRCYKGVYEKRVPKK
jgi:hypothetical protein